MIEKAQDRESYAYESSGRFVVYLPWLAYTKLFVVYSVGVLITLTAPLQPLHNHYNHYNHYNHNHPRSAPYRIPSQTWGP
jgi:hypothetical protein